MCIRTIAYTTLPVAFLLLRVLLLALWTFLVDGRVHGCHNQHVILALPSSGHLGMNPYVQYHVAYKIINVLMTYLHYSKSSNICLQKYTIQPEPRYYHIVWAYYTHGKKMLLVAGCFETFLSFQSFNEDVSISSHLMSYVNTFFSGKNTPCFGTSS